MTLACNIGMKKGPSQSRGQSIWEVAAFHHHGLIKKEPAAVMTVTDRP